MEQILNAFKKLQLNVELDKSMPSFMRVRGNRDLFTLRVETKRRGTRIEEKFLLHPGKDNRVEVLDIDKHNRQLVLMVHEEKGTFQIKQYDATQKKDVLVTHTVLDRKVKYLIGMDERSYFMAPLPGSPTTVAQAHRALRPNQIRERDAQKKKAIRQGEWFFVPFDGVVPASALVYKDEGLRLRPNDRIAGKPHMATEVVWVSMRREEFLPTPGHPWRTRISGDNIVLARGKVRHPDHETVELQSWHRVYHNREERSGTQWID